MSANRLHDSPHALMLQAKQYREEHSLRLALHSWAGETNLQALGRHFLIQTLLRQLTAAWAAWLHMVEVRAANPGCRQCTCIGNREGCKLS